MTSLASTGPVPYKALGDLATIFGGLTGKSKADFADGNARYVSYTNIFNNPASRIDAADFVHVGPTERQRPLRQGDILFTGSSETRSEVATSSVITSEVTEPLYLNSFSIACRPAGGLLVPEFSKHLFRSRALRQQLVGTASGVTRFNVSKARLARVRIPLPPLEMQRRVAEVLDSFTQLEAELEAELEARRRQYAHHRDTMVLDSAVQVPLHELGKFSRGRRFTKADVVETGIPSIHYGEIYTDYGVAAQSTTSHVRSELRPSLRYANTNDVIIAGVGETVEDVGKAVAWLGVEPVAYHDDCFAFTHDLNPKFVAYAMQTEDFHRQKDKYVSRAKVKRLSADGLGKILIPAPPRDEQDRIVDVLDSFDALVNDLSVGLPAELAARRKQYEYYRDKLLTFPEAS